MLPTITALETASSTANQDNYVTGSVVFPAGSIAIAVIRSTQGTNAAVPATVVTTGLTWVQIATAVLSGSPRTTVFAAVVGAVDVTGTVTFTWTDANPTQTSGMWGLGYITGTRQATGSLIARLEASRNAQTGWNALDAVTAFSEPGTSATLGFVGHGAAEATTPPTDWTELGDDTEATPNGALEWAWVAGEDLTPDFAWATSSGYNIIILEVLADRYMMAQAFPFYYGGYEDVGGDQRRRAL